MPKDQRTFTKEFKLEAVQLAQTRPNTNVEAVAHACTQAWSNGMVEGFNHKLKLIKRSSYGQACKFGDSGGGIWIIVRV